MIVLLRNLKHFGLVHWARKKLKTVKKTSNFISHLNFNNLRFHRRHLLLHNMLSSLLLELARMEIQRQTFT